MGQMTYALMFGCELPEAPTGKCWFGDVDDETGEWQDGLIDIFNHDIEARADEVDTDENNELVGFLVAIGASGCDGIPCLEGPLDLSKLDEDERYKAAGIKAAANWFKFEAFCKNNGATFGMSSLYLVEIEVA